MRFKRNVLGLILGSFGVAALGMACEGGPGTNPVGNADKGATIFRQIGDGTGTTQACASCHCPNATGGCGSGAPNIVGKDFTTISARTRDQNVAHPGGKFSFSDQDVADIEAFLADPTAIPIQ